MPGWRAQRGKFLGFHHSETPSFVSSRVQRACKLVPSSGRSSGGAEASPTATKCRLWGKGQGGGEVEGFKNKSLTLRVWLLRSVCVQACAFLCFFLCAPDAYYVLCTTKSLPGKVRTEALTGKTLVSSSSCPGEARASPTGVWLLRLVWVQVSAFLWLLCVP